MKTHSRYRSIPLSSVDRISIGSSNELTVLWGAWRVKEGHLANRVAPVAELCERLLEEYGRNTKGRKADQLGRVLETIEDYSTLSIKEHIDRKRSSVITSAETEKEAVACALAGGLTALVRWWLENGAKEAPCEIDKLFHGMVWKGLQAAESNRPLGRRN